MIRRRHRLFFCRLDGGGLPKQEKVAPAAFASSGARDQLLTQLSEFSASTARSGGQNTMMVLNMVHLLMTDLQGKDAPEAYMMTALYEAPSTRFTKPSSAKMSKISMKY